MLPPPSSVHAHCGVNPPKRLWLHTVLILTLTVAGCGGGGSSGGATTSNIFNDRVGTYASGCATTFNDSPDSTKVTLTLSEPTGADTIKAVIRIQNFDATRLCVDANLDNDVTITGTIQALAGTKEIASFIASFQGGISGTANTARFNLSVLPTQLAGSIPNNWMPGMTATVGYKFVGNNFHALVNAVDEADGLGAYFSTIVLVKQ